MLSGLCDCGKRWCTRDNRAPQGEVRPHFLHRQQSSCKDCLCRCRKVSHTGHFGTRWQEVGFDQRKQNNININKLLHKLNEPSTDSFLSYEIRNNIFTFRFVYVPARCTSTTQVTFSWSLVDSFGESSATRDRHALLRTMFSVPGMCRFVY